MENTFFLESLSTMTATTAFSESEIQFNYEVISEGVNSFDRELLESEIAYQQIMMESAALEVRSLMEADESGNGEEAATGNFFQKIAAWFKELGAKIAAFFQSVLKKIKENFAKVRAWLADKMNKLKNKAGQIKFRSINKWKGGLPSITNVTSIASKSSSASSEEAVKALVEQIEGMRLGRKDEKGTMSNMGGDVGQATLAVAIANIRGSEKALETVSDQFRNIMRECKKNEDKARSALKGTKGEESKSARSELVAAKGLTKAQNGLCSAATRTINAVVKDSQLACSTAMKEDLAVSNKATKDQIKGVDAKGKEKRAAVKDAKAAGKQRNAEIKDAYGRAVKP